MELRIANRHGTYIYYLCMFILRLHSRANKGVTCTHVERNLRRCMCSTLLTCIGNPPLPAKYCTRLGIVLITPTHQQINFDSQYIYTSPRPHCGVRLFRFVFFSFFSSIKFFVLIIIISLSYCSLHCYLLMMIMYDAS